jgi:TPR repeat protein
MVEGQLDMGYAAQGLAEQSANDAAQQEELFVDSAKWFNRAAKQNSGKISLEAYNSLGDLHLKGQGVEQSDELAAKNYKRAAEQGDIVAQCNLATMIMLKRTEGTDEEVSRSCFIRAGAGVMPILLF